jgi:hypothetical protein
MKITGKGPSSVGKRFPRQHDRAFCIVCDKPVELLGFQVSADLFKTDVQDIEYLASRSEIHRLHNSRGEVMICAASLFASFGERPTRLLDSHFGLSITNRFSGHQ